MADIYLAPKDVNTRDAQLVLTFLNSAQTAQEIANRVEIPGELDIGVKLGERLLNARTELDGAFENLEQIYAVPLIGPERFTEIVLTLTGKTALQILTAGGRNNLTAEVLNVTAQLDTLRQLMKDLQQFDQRRYRIEFKAVDKTSYLGEIITLKLRVVDRASNVTQANMPVTLETNWGHLRYAKGYRVLSGSVISARTGVDGQLTCQLYTPTSEPLTESQQNELSNALAKLSNDALVPADIEAGFQYLTSLYQHPLNRDFRAAIDIHYKSRQTRLVDTVNRSAALYGWNYEQALLRVYLHPYEETEKSTVLAMAALPLEYRDWLVPWYQIYKDGLSRKGELNTALKLALNYSANERGLASQMLANMQTFIAQQNGLIGERAAQQVSQEVVTDFITDNLANLSDNSQTTLLTLLREAPSSMKAGSAGQIGVANQVAVEVGRKEGIFDVTGQLGQLQSDITGINSRVSTMETATANVNFSQLSADITAFNNNYSAFLNNYNTFNQNFSSFRTNYDNFVGSFNSFEAQLTHFDIVLNERSAEFDTRFAQFDSDLQSFSQTVDNFNKTKNQLVANVTEGVNAALHTLEATNPTRVTIKPIENVNLDRIVVTRPPVR